LPFHAEGHIVCNREANSTAFNSRHRDRHLNLGVLRSPLSQTCAAIIRLDNGRNVSHASRQKSDIAA
jgi:hypothetical protein